MMSKKSERERHNKAVRKWRRNHRKECVDYSRKWRKDNPEQSREQAKRTALRHPEAAARRRKRWRKNHPNWRYHRKPSLLEKLGLIKVQSHKERYCKLYIVKYHFPYEYAFRRKMKIRATSMAAARKNFSKRFPNMRIDLIVWQHHQ